MNMRIVKTTTSDGIIYSGLLSKPETPAHKIIIHIHGMSGDIYSNNYYPYMYEQYPINGFAFLAVEHRGTHSITQFLTVEDEIKNIGNAYEVFEESFYDIDAMVKKALDLGYTEIWLQAHSLGPSKVLNYINTSAEKSISGLILLSPVAMLDMATFEKSHFDSMLEEAKMLVEQNKGDALLSKELSDTKISANTFVNFFDTDRFSQLISYDFPQKCQETFNKLSMPVIGITGTEDEGIAPAKDAYEAMKIFESLLVNSPRKKTVVYEGAHHSFDGFEQNIVDDVLKFVKH